MHYHELNLPKWSKYVIETPAGIFQPHQYLVENIFRIVSSRGWNWRDDGKIPSHVCFHGNITNPDFSKYYSLGESLTLDGVLLESFVNKIKLATSEIELGHDAVSPIPNVEFTGVDIDKTSVEKHFCETLLVGNQSVMNVKNPIKKGVDLLVTFLSNEIVEFAEAENMEHIYKTAAIIDTQRASENDDYIPTKLKVNSMQYNRMIDHKAELNLDEIHKFFKALITKDMLGSFLESVRQAPIRIHQLLLTLNIKQ